MMLLVQQRRPEKLGGGRLYIIDEIRGVSSSKSSLPPGIKGITERGTTGRITDHTKHAEWPEDRNVSFSNMIGPGLHNVSGPSPPFTILNLKKWLQTGNLLLQEEALCPKGLNGMTFITSKPSYSV